MFTHFYGIYLLLKVPYTLSNAIFLKTIQTAPSVYLGWIAVVPYLGPFSEILNLPSYNRRKPTLKFYKTNYHDQTC